MAQVKGTATIPLVYKHKRYEVGEEVVFLDALHAARYEKNGFVKLDKETEKKVDAALEKQEKNSKAGPGK